jgi:hypothetical protein
MNLRRQLKTKWMLLLEAQDKTGRSIEQIMIDNYIEHKTMRAASRAMGITITTFSDWMYRLSIELPEGQNEQPYPAA